MRAKLSKTVLTVSAAAAILAAGGGFVLASAASTSPTYRGCIEGTSRFIEDVHVNAPVTCPKGTIAVTWNQAGPQGTTGATGPQGPQGPPGPSDLTVTATTHVSNRDDSGGNGNWATDTFTRAVTITRHEAVPVSNCGGAVATCYYYTGTLADSAGTFVTDAGAFTPNQGCAGCSGERISGTVSGTFTGGSAIEFYASSNAPNPALVPATVSGDTPSGGDWYQQFFPSGTAFSGTANLINWSWQYQAPGTCETWTDAYNNSDGQSATAGNIAGINGC